MAQIIDTLPEHWKYVSEGGATVVFSYVGPPHPQFNGTVLRLRKSTLPQASLYELQDEPDDPMIEYQQKCMERLIPVQHLPRLESVRITRGWLEELVSLHDIERPEGRKHKDQVDLTRTKGVLATDLVGGEWLAVEIKPKWAFLPPSTHLSSATRTVKTQTCRFCMHSSMKAENGETVASGYCPLDLFSGNEGRVEKAIHSLWDAWIDSNGTVNNLKVFVRGKTISPSEAPLMFADGLKSSEFDGNLRRAFTSALLPLLLGTPVLSTLSKLQRSLDVLDIEGLSALWRLAETSAQLDHMLPTSTTDPGSVPPLVLPSTPIGVSSTFLKSPEPVMADWVKFLDIYLSPTSSRPNPLEPVLEDLRYYLLAYLLSATFKDCSIIIRLDLLRPTMLFAGVINPDCIKVIDLDPKSMARLQKWERLDQEIVRAYLASTHRKVCIDEWAA